MVCAAPARRLVVAILFLALVVVGCARQAPPVAVADDPAPAPIVIAPDPQQPNPDPPRPEPEPVALKGLPIGPRAVPREVAPDRAAGQKIGTLCGILGSHTHPVEHVAFTRDGRWILASGMNPSFTAWDLKTGEVAHKYPILPPKERYGSVRIWSSPDGITLATNGPEDNLWLWDLTTGTVRKKLKARDSFDQVAFTADGRTLFTLNRQRVHRWDAATGEETTVSAEVGAFLCDALVVTPDGKTVALGGADGALVFLDGRTLRETKRLSAHPERIHALALSPDGKTLATTGFQDKLVKLWDPETATEIRSIKYSVENVRQLVIAFSPSGKLLAVGKNRVSLWEVATGTERGELPNDYRSVRSLAFSPSGTVLAGALDEDPGGVAVWELAPHTDVFRQSPTAPPPPVYVPVRAVLKGHSASHRFAAFTADGSRLVSVDGKGGVVIWDPATGKQLKKLDTAIREFNHVSMSVDGKRLAFAREDMSVHIWNLDTESEEYRIQTGYKWLIGPLAFSPDGKLLATGGKSGIDSTDRRPVLLWDVETGKKVGGFDPLSVQWLAFTNEGKLFVTEQGGGVHLFDVVERTKRPVNQPPEVVRAVSADGARVLVGPIGETFGGGLAVWDRVTGKLSPTLYVDNRGIDAVAFGPDGLIAVNTGNVFLWDTKSGKSICQFSAPGVTAISPDGKTLVVVRDWLSDKESLLLLDLPTLRDERFQAALRPALALGAKITPDGDGLRVEMSVGGPDTLAALAALDQLSKPFTLVVGASVLPDAAVQTITKLKNLRELGVRTATSDDAVTALAALPAFTELILNNEYNVKLNAADAARIKSLKNLRRLRITGLLQGDADLALLSDLNRLKELDLSGRSVTDAGLAHLKGMTDLETLNLRKTWVTDAGLVHLEGLSKLRRLSIGETKVTKKGIEELKKKLPKLEIDTD